jgi:hypothetical protein
MSMRLVEIESGAPGSTGFAISMEAAVRACCADMNWLRPSDNAAVELAIKYAKWLDLMPKPDYVAKDIGNRLERILIELGGTPSARLKMFGEGQQVNGRLAELRRARKGA